MAGRPPKPVEQHKKDGTYRKDRHASRGCNLKTLKDLSKPVFRTEKVSKEWDNIIPQLCETDLISDVDIPVIERAFYYLDYAQELTNKIEEQGGPAKSFLALRNVDRNPMDEIRKAMNEFNKIMYKFGMTPVERARIKQTNPEKENFDSNIMAIIGNG